MLGGGIQCLMHRVLRRSAGEACTGFPFFCSALAVHLPLPTSGMTLPLLSFSVGPLSLLEQPDGQGGPRDPEQGPLR